jgi:hypothetical protein
LIDTHGVGFIRIGVMGGYFEEILHENTLAVGVFKLGFEVHVEFFFPLLEFI